MPVLFAFREDRLGFRYEIDDKVVIGRSPESDLILFDQAISRFHTEIARNEDGYYVKDLGSSNGTFLNGVEVQAPTLLARNSEVKLGDELFIFDPDLDMAVGQDGVALIVGEVKTPEAVISLSGEPQPADLDRPSLAALYKITVALAKYTRLVNVLRQTAFVLEKLFKAQQIALLWPQGVSATRLVALTIQPQGGHLVLARPMVERVLGQGQAVIWPNLLGQLGFSHGERQLAEEPGSCMAVPLLRKNEASGLLYVGSREQAYTERDLRLLAALAGVVTPVVSSTRYIGELSHRALREDEAAADRIFLIGEHPQVKALRAMTAQVAQTDDRVLIEGEPGTGKEVLARLIHSLGARRKHPFMRINCAAIPANKIRHELFGQEAGSVSDEEWPGLVETAEGGTLFIRNINHLDMAVQADLLRAIEEGVIYRVGSYRPRPVNFRAITSTTEDLKTLMDQGVFREDLFQRIAEVSLATYPLREVREDILLLAKHFIGEAARARGRPAPELDQAATECLLAYFWPGNAQELKNVLERLMMFHHGRHVLADDLPLEVRLSVEAFKAEAGERTSETVLDVEKDLLRRALAKTNGDEVRAAEVLKLPPDVVKEKIRHYGIGLEQTVIMEISEV
jgi:DNA-binding NtrC family response regulator